MKRFVLFVLLTLWLLGIFYSAQAAEFDENSANFTNSYAPFSPGMVMVYNYYAPVPDADPPCTEPTCMEATGMVQYWNCIGTDIVDGVKCLKANRVIRSPVLPTSSAGKEVQYNVLLTDWFAQSTDGAVYLLQTLRYHQPTGSQMITFGAENAILHTPAEADIPAAVAAGTYTSVPELALGATGLGTFKGCIKGTNEIYGDFYVAPGIGTVRNVDPNGAFNELVAWEFPLAVQTSYYDISGDGKTGLAEAIYALQVAAGLASQGTFTLSTDVFVNDVIPTDYTCNTNSILKSANNNSVIIQNIVLYPV